MIVIDRAQYAQEVGEPEELLEPIPCAALAMNGVTITPFKLMFPRCENQLIAHFLIDFEGWLLQGAIRYGNFKPVFLPFDKPRFVMKEDEIGLILHTRSSRPSGIRRFRS